VTSIAFSLDGKLLASAGFDNSILLWDIEQNSQVGPPLKIHSGTINSIAFGDDQAALPGLYLISGSDDRTLIKWDLSARQPISRSLERASAELQLTAQNSKYEASANGQQVEVKLRQSSDSFLVISGFTAQILSVEFEAENPDILFTTDQNQQSTSWYTEWIIDPQVWETRACDAIKENITKQQWFLFLQNLSGRPPKEQCITQP
jgi:WD40 repeat protein